MASAAPRAGGRPADATSPGDAAAAGEDDAKTSASPSAPTLKPLTEADATTGLFAGRPRFNELLSVIKLTWKLMRRSR